ncbi:hypothetical protein V6N13_116946 [Hibiscus sabdariffa]
MVGRRARKSMSGAADDSTTKFPISGKVPLEWLMHRLANKRSTRALPVALMIHDNLTDRTAIVPATHHSNFCPINF